MCMANLDSAEAIGSKPGEKLMICLQLVTHLKGILERAIFIHQQM